MPKNIALTPVVGGCAQNGVQPVYLNRKTVSELCNLIVQKQYEHVTLGTSYTLSPVLYTGCAQFYPLQKYSNNRDVHRVVPSIHRPNNKNDIGYLKKIYRKTVEEAKL
jgi:hypothetical protein